MTGSEFRRERLGQERLGLGAKWQYGRCEFTGTLCEFTGTVESHILTRVMYSAVMASLDLPMYQVKSITSTNTEGWPYC